MRLDLLKELNVERAARRPAVLVTDTGSGAQRLVKGGAFADDPLAEEIADALRMGKSRALAHEGADYFLTVQAPPVRFVAIATVVETWGSAPRPVGSHLVIDDAGHFLGSVSGGCVEADVVSEALDVIAAGAPRTLEFGVADETAWRSGLSCGGRIKVYVEKVG